MRKLVFCLAAAFCFFSCSRHPEAELTLEVAGAADSTEIIVYKLQMNALMAVDTVVLTSGQARCRLECAEGMPDFYYLDIEGRQVPLLASSGDRLDVRIEKSGDFTVSGSDEAVLLSDIEREFAAYQKIFDALSDTMAMTVNGGDRALATAAASKLSLSFIDFKKTSIRHIIDNPASMTNVPILFRKVSGTLPVFGRNEDIALFQKVYDTLSVLFPKSPYIAALKAEIDSRSNAIELSNMLSSAKAVSYPDITLPDISGELKQLSSLSGNVVLLMFWNIEMKNGSVMNAELKRIYEKYHPSGLEIYQVALCADKTSWASAVKSQALPWVSVVDTQGAGSLNAANFNIMQLPSVFIISREGSIVARDVLERDKLERTISSQLNK